MDLDYDLRLRLALFDHIDRLRREGGGLIGYRRLNEGLAFEDRRVPIWNQQQGIFRPAALRESGIALTVPTSFRSPYEDRAEPDDDRFIYRHRGEDPEHADNVALRRAMETGRPILYLVAVKPGVYQPIFPTYVVGDVPERDRPRRDYLAERFEAFRAA